MDETARKRAVGRAIVDGMGGGRVEVDFEARMGLVDWLMDCPVRVMDGAVVPWRDEDERRKREDFCGALVEAQRAHGIEIPAEITARLLKWLLTGPEL